MQLKRDTGYALQIIHCLLENPGKMDASEISRHSGVPRTIAIRLCSALWENGIITRDVPPGELFEHHYFYLGENFSVSLGEIVFAIEKQNDLLAVFDKKSAMYRCYSSDLQLVNQKIEACLKEMKIEKIHEVDLCENLSK